jgi:ribosome recycling factor
MAYDFKGLSKQIEDAKEWLRKEYTGVRTGRAAPGLLDSVQVAAYGVKMPLNQVASIGVETARMLRVTPYDATQAKEIEKAITNANLGVSIGSDERGIRVSFPEMTAERRQLLLKLLKEKLEEARVSIRKARDEVWEDIQKQERNSEITEDEKFRYKDEMQEYIDEGNKELEALMARKEAEVLEK